MLLIFPLFTLALVNLSVEVDAAKSKGDSAPGRLGTDSYESKTSGKVCGDRLCSKISSAKQPSKIAKTTVTKTSQPSQDESKPQAEMALRLLRANVPAMIPLHKGWYNEAVYLIITNTSEQKHADITTEKQGWEVELVPLLANAAEAALSKTYIFTNGIKANGIQSFQGEVFTGSPAQPDTYNAFCSCNIG